MAVSLDALFTQDGAVCRVICRIDCGVNDANGLVSHRGHRRREASAVEQGEQVERQVTDTDTPRDPDWDDVPLDLEALARLDHGQVTVLTEDGVGPAELVVVPSLFAHARRLKEAAAGTPRTTTTGRDDEDRDAGGGAAADVHRRPPNERTDDDDVSTAG